MGEGGWWGMGSDGEIGEEEVVVEDIIEGIVEAFEVGGEREVGEEEREEGEEGDEVAEGIGVRHHREERERVAKVFM